MENVVVFQGHLNETTAAAFAPTGGLIASGDAKGCVRIWCWDHPNLLVKKELDFVISGRIRQIKFSSDSQKIVVCGEGSQLHAKVISIDTGSSVGEIGGNSKPLLCCAISTHKKPFNLAVGGEDQIINFYQGPPFKFKHTNQKSHTNFVTDMKFNSSGDTLVTVSTDKRIALHDPEQATEKGEIKDGAHAGTISSVNFIDDSTLYTTSMDKTVRVYSLETNTLQKKFIVNKKPEVDDMQVAGVPLPDGGLLSLSLSGAINIWKKYASLENDSLPSEVLAGHQSSITSVLYSSALDRVVSYDTNGRIIVWVGHHGVFPQGKGHGKQITFASLNRSQKVAFSVSNDGVIRFLNLETNTLEGQAEAKGNIVGLAASKGNNDVVYAISDNKKTLYVVDQLKVTEVALNFTPTCIDSANDGQRLFIGCNDGNIRVVVVNGGKAEVKETLTHKAETKVTAIRVSNGEDKFLVSGDNLKNVILFNAQDYTRLTNQWLYHSSMVRDFAFSPDNKYVLSCSLDTSIILYNTETLQKIQVLDRIHRFDINKLTFVNDGTFLSAGADALLKQYKLAKKE